MARGGLAADAPQPMVGGLNANAGAGAVRDPLRCPGEADDPKEQPFAPPLFVLTGHPRRYHRPLGGCAIGEGVAGALAPAALTPLACAPLLATHGTGDDRRLLLLLPVAHDLAAAEAAVQIQHAHTPREGLKSLAQTAPTSTDVSSGKTKVTARGRRPWR